MQTEIQALATEAAKALIQLLTTDLWSAAKKAAVALWQRACPDRAAAVEAELTQARLDLLAALERGDDQPALLLTGEWAGMLRSLPLEGPRLASELGVLLSQLRDAATVCHGEHWDVRMQARASGQGQVYQAGRDQHITER